MKFVSTTILAITFLTGIFFHPVNAQSDNESETSIRSFRKGVIVTKDRKRHKGTGISFLSESITIQDASSHNKSTFPKSDVDHVRAEVGSHVLEGALYGGGFMALSCLYAVADINSDPYRETKDNAGEIITGFIVGGVVVGALIGACFPKEKVVYKRGKFLVDTKALPTTPYSPVNSYCLSVSFRYPL